MNRNAVSVILRTIIFISMVMLYREKGDKHTLKPTILAREQTITTTQNLENLYDYKSWHRKSAIDTFSNDFGLLLLLRVHKITNCNYGSLTKNVQISLLRAYFRLVYHITLANYQATQIAQTTSFHTVIFSAALVVQVGNIISVHSFLFLLLSLDPVIILFHQKTLLCGQPF